MKITFVAHNDTGAERYEIFDLKSKDNNPFKETPEGEPIQLTSLVDLIGTGGWNRSQNSRKIRHFCLDAIVDKYLDIRYYWGQN